MQKNYKYIIVISALLLQATTFCIAANLQPLFMPHIITTTGITTLNISIVMLITSMVSASLQPFLGKLFGKIPTKIIFVVGAILSGFGFFFSSFGGMMQISETVSSSKIMGMFILSGIIMQIGTVLFSGLGIPYLIAEWFTPKHKATALGIVFTGGSIGNMFMQPFVSNLLMKESVSSSYQLLGISSILIGFLITMIFIRDPKKKEIENKIIIEEKKDEEMNLGVDLKFVLNTKEFKLLAISFGIIAMSISALSIQYANYFNYTFGAQRGAVISGTFGSIFAISCLIGNFGGGFLFSYLGLKRTMIISFILQLLAITGMLLLPVNSIFAGMWAVFYGLNVFSYMSGPSMIAQNLYGLKYSSKILGVLGLVFAVGFSIGNLIFSAIYNATETFELSWISVLIYIIIGFVMLITMIGKIEKKKYHQIKS